jgi:hypothetical protein
MTTAKASGQKPRRQKDHETEGRCSQEIKREGKRFPPCIGSGVCQKPHPWVTRENPRNSFFGVENEEHLESHLTNERATPGMQEHASHQARCCFTSGGSD